MIQSLSKSKRLVRDSVRNIAESFGITSIFGWEVDGIKVYIVSYPKSGRTWLRVLLGKALCEQFNIDSKLLLETHQLSRVAKILPTLFTHEQSALAAGYHWNSLKFNSSLYRTKKVVFLVRHPYDTLVSSYFHAQKRLKIFSGSMSEFVRSENLGIRKILMFNKMWFEHQNNPQDFLVLRYEDLHQNTHQCLRSLLNIVGVSSVSDEIISQAVDFADFDNLKKLEKEKYFQNSMLQTTNEADNNSYKVRQGKIGGYVNYLTSEDIEYLDKITLEVGNPWYD